eukprot:7388844-Prymnesium_polylepis.1
MPSTVVELYKVAIDAMLTRAGESSSAADRALLQAVFFRAHCRKSRAITLRTSTPRRRSCQTARRR